MTNKHSSSKAWVLYLKVPRGFKEKLLAFSMRILDHFLKSPPFKKALADVIQKNQANVREMLDIWGGGFSSKETANVSSPAAYFTELSASKRAIEDIVLSGVLRNKRPPDFPECSIIMPVWNKDYFTYLCIRSILKAKVNASFEIIVVDNGSTDNTPEILGYFGEWVRVVRNDENKGFVIAANQGAAVAKGNFLVFLNNDTEVQDGWLDRLVETVKISEDIGAVGAKLIYPDGVLQEAGGIIWQDASGTNHGRGDDSNKPEYNYLREVDYCSGACLLVRRDIFKRLGGFDMRYAPAYYEDTDICFGIRSLGYRVLYQPLCEVVHYEGATAGRDTDSGFKRFQDVNKVKFAAKWKAALKLQKPPLPENIIAAADRRVGQRILFVDYQVPKCDQDSGSVRIFAIMKILVQLGCRVSFMLRWGQPFDNYAMALGGIGVRLVCEEGDRVWNELSRGGFDLVVVSRVDVAELYLDKIRSAAPDTPVVFDTVDVHFIRQMRMAE
ncbi:MAG: glycosyltransferase family 2 protein, partial [Nitrospirota bacterium]